MTAVLQALGLVTSLGIGKRENASLLAAGQRGLTARVELLDGTIVPYGMVDGPLAEVPRNLATYESRNLALALTALEEIDAEVRSAIERFGPDRIAVVMGSSTSGIESGLEALEAAPSPDQLPRNFDFAQQELGSVSESLARHYGLCAPALTIATACSSSAKALAAARRLLAQNHADAVIAGGVDSFARLTINGFHALQALDREPCRPFDASRAGINIGEAAAIFLLAREDGPVLLEGVGESSDGYNMTAPRPDGRGAILAMTRALRDASRAPADIHYVNLHATGTRLNDAMEAQAVYDVFGSHTLCSGSKGQVGHTLGAAGAVEAAFCWLALAGYLENSRIPPHVGCNGADPAFPPLSLAGVGTSLGGPLRTAMSSSYAFGGSNISLVLTASA